LPVAFCYPVVQTETLGDVSIDTLEAHRLESNTASRTLAARLGLIETDRLTVFGVRS